MSKHYKTSNSLLKIFSTSLLTACMLMVFATQPISASNALPNESSLNQQEGRLSGVVIDEQNEPMIGVSVTVEGKTAGAATDINGAFTLTNIAVGDVLHFSFIGYEAQTITVSNFNNLRVTLKESDIMLGEVVVTALGIKREQKALSYNVQELKGDALLAVKDVNPINSLAGKIAGVDINTSASGIGGATRVVMRGTKSITKDNNALYVIDGVPIFNNNRGGLDENTEYQNPSGGEGISDLNPEDIESMSVLTGPSAAALYGSSAANGVIIITTKKGAAGKPRVTVSNQTSFSKPFVMPFFQNTYGNVPGSYSSWGDKTNKRYNPEDYFNTGVQIQTSASVSMGSESNQTYVSVSNTDAEGIIPGNKYGKNTVSARNTTNFLNDKMTLDFGFTYIKQKDANMVAQGQYYNPLVPVYTYPRNEDLGLMKNFETYQEDIKLNTQNWQWGEQNLTMQNPYWIEKRNPIRNKKDRYMMNINLSYDILDWLNVSGRIRFDNANNEYSQKKYYSTESKLVSGGKSAYKSTIIRDKQTYADLLINIDKRFNDYTINANIGTSYSDMRSNENGFDALMEIPNFFAWSNIDRSDNKMDMIESGWHEQTQSIFANVELGWKSMLYLTLTGRNDWASALARTKNSSFFYPSAGLSGVVSEMFTMPKAISYLQVRGSFASVGSAIPRNLSIMTYPKVDNAWNTTTYMPLSDLKPERTNSWELGLSSKFFGNKLSFDFTWYKSNTKNQTLNIDLSASSGYKSMYIQTGDVQNSGIETRLGTDFTWGDWSWSSNLTASYNKNEIKSLMDGQYYGPDGELLPNIPRLSQGGVGAAEIFLTKGGSMGDLYIKNQLGRNADGSMQRNEDGSPTIITLGGDDMKKAGSVLPDWNLGFRNDFRWKNINLGFLLSGRFGGVVVSQTQAILEGFGVGENSAIARDKGGIPTGKGDEKMSAETYYKATGSQTGLMGDYVYDADNIRLAELTIGYTLPRKWFNNVVQMHIAFVGRNLWMIKNDAPFDPQATASTGTYYQGFDYFMQPTTRNLGFQIRLDF